jgi:hypothetical protein
MIRFRDHTLSVMVIYAIVLHLVWVGCLWLDEGVANVTAVYAIRYVLPKPFAVMGMAVVALCAMASFAMRNRFLAAGLMVPQQMLLFVSAGGAIQAIVEGHFADGVERPWTFLLADQSPAILAAIGHTLALVGVLRYGWIGR